MKPYERKAPFLETSIHYMSFGILSIGALTHQLLAYADDVNILEGSVQTVKENAECVLMDDILD
jgi:hypothetical protein